MLQQAPQALQLPLQQLLPSFVAHPSLFKYENMHLLAQRYHELAACFKQQGVSFASVRCVAAVQHACHAT
jgi:hypothetical protein